MGIERSDFLGFCVALSLLICFVCVGLFDIWARLLGPPGAFTVSNWVQLWSREYPFLPFAAGVLVGHLWFPGGLIR